MSKIYAIVGQSLQTVISDGVSYSPAENEILMQSERPEGENIVAHEDGTWGAPIIPIETLKEEKINELKAIRDQKEVEPIETDKGLFDYDNKARERLAIARQSLEDNQDISSIFWTTADNRRVEMSIEDFKNINSIAAVRSNALHIKYNELKEQVNECTTNEEVNSITWAE